MPVYQGFCGPSNPTQSLMADCERTVNMYLERVESPSAPTGSALFPTPGFRHRLTVPHTDGRAGLAVAGRAFVVVGTGFYEIFEGDTRTLRGTVALDANPATISYNGTAGGQLFITSGGHGYCYVMSSHAFTQVLTAEATMGGMLNARFLAFNITNGKVKFSALNDGTTWGANDFFQRTLAPDPWQSMLINPPHIWLIGEQTGEVWYDSGAFPMPFAPIPGAFFTYGTPAPFSAAVAGEYVTWLSRGVGGAGTIVAARGYTPQPISNFAVDTAIAGYARTSSIEDCEVLVYDDQGHRHVNYSFPTANATWTCDLSMGMAWHERGTYDSANSRYNVWRPRVHLYAFGKHLVGERGTGAIAEMDVLFGSESDGGPIRRLRIGPPLWATAAQRLLISRFQVMVESGLGLPIGQGSDPQLMARFSKDAKTWSSTVMASAGKLGEYSRRCVFRRCGSSDFLWVPEVTATDPVPWRWSGAEIDGTGFQQQNRQAA